MLRLKVGSVLSQIEGGACAVWVANGTINNDPITFALIGNFGCSISHLMVPGENYNVEGHFKEAFHLGYDKLFIITNVILDPSEKKGTRLNYYA